MPYIHTHCGGEVNFWTRRCKKCGKKCASVFSYFSLIPPKNMIFDPRYEVKHGKTSYAKFGDRVPGAGLIASWLPNWPRWARILTAIIIVGGIITLVIWLVF